MGMRQARLAHSASQPLLDYYYYIRHLSFIRASLTRNGIKVDLLQYIPRHSWVWKLKFVRRMILHTLHTPTHMQGRCAGIIIGCTIGMAPLLWFDDPHKESDHES